MLQQTDGRILYAPALLDSEIASGMKGKRLCCQFCGVQYSLQSGLELVLSKFTTLGLVLKASQKKDGGRIAIDETVPSDYEEKWKRLG
jgi:hypothetical protein